MYLKFENKTAPIIGNEVFGYSDDEEGTSWVGHETGGVIAIPHDSNGYINADGIPEPWLAPLIDKSGFNIYIDSELPRH